jgi:hypothetical protein
MQLHTVLSGRPSLTVSGDVTVIGLAKAQTTPFSNMPYI